MSRDGWLSGMNEIGHHTLSDELDDLFSQLLTVPVGAGENERYRS